MFEVVLHMQLPCPKGFNSCRDCYQDTSWLPQLLAGPTSGPSLKAVVIKVNTILSGLRLDTCYTNVHFSQNCKLPAMNN